MLELLLGDSVDGKKIGEVEAPLGGNPIAIGVGLGEVVASIEEENRDVGAQLSGEMEEENVLGLETAGQACIDFARVSRQLTKEEGADVRELGFERGIEWGTRTFA